MISRLIIKYHDKVYSIPISHYTCEDVEHWGDHLRVKPVHITKELYRDSVYKCFTIITLEQIEWPVPQDFHIL